MIESFVMAAQFLFLLAGPAYHAAPQWLVFGCLLEVARLTINPWTMSALATKLPAIRGACRWRCRQCAERGIGLCAGSFALGIWHGPAAAVLLATGGAVMVGYPHLRTSAAFVPMLSVKLS
ncbi:hypothetical protein [Thermosynechococcus sp. NK55a]|uniref:hypothetical protein n=1 Tax=Thermosynechococcus sp. NK55a TaxID=1394889 RepID=UPI0012FED466|nr:hypothetical protein [Thermosynechococcus sp. NK55a]